MSLDPASPPPTITVQPVSQQVYVGQNVTFSVSATTASGATPTYQWERNGANVNFNLQYANTASFVIENVGILGVVGSYTVVVTDPTSGAFVRSNVAELDVLNTSINIITLPESQTVALGQPVTFSVTATGAPAPLRYTWFRTSGFGNSEQVQTGIGVSASTYTIPSVIAEDANYKYFVRIDVNWETGQPGALFSTQVSQNAGASLIIEAAPVPVITVTRDGAASPLANGGTVYPGEVFTIAVANGSGSNVPTVTEIAEQPVAVAGSSGTWTFNVDAIPSYEALTISYPGAAGVTLNIGMAVFTTINNTLTRIADEETTSPPTVYRGVSVFVRGIAKYAKINEDNSFTTIQAVNEQDIVIVGTGPNATPGNMQLSFNPGAGGGTTIRLRTFVTESDEVTVRPYENVSFTALNVASRQFQVTRASDGSVVPTGSTVYKGVTLQVAEVGGPQNTVTWTWGKIGGIPIGTGSSVYIPPNTRLTLLNPFSVMPSASGFSTTWQVTMATAPNTPPQIDTQPQSQSVSAGGSVTLTVVASGTFPLTYQWRKGTTNINGAASASLSINSAAAGDAGDYSVVVSNAYGSATSDVATLTVNTPTPAITLTDASGSSLSNAANVSAGAIITITISNAVAGTLPVVWDTSRAATQVPIASIGNDKWTFVAPRMAGINTYVGVTVLYSGATYVTLYVNTPPQIDTQPQSQSVSAGSSVTLTVVASGTYPLSYQWRKGTTNINGATSASLSIGSAAAGDAGDYSVVVSNAYGSATSNAATVTVTSSGGGNQDVICFAPDVRLRMADGSYKRVAEISKGERVAIARIGASGPALRDAAVTHVRRDDAAADASGRAGHAQLYAFAPRPDIRVTCRHTVIHAGILACSAAHPNFVKVTHGPHEAITVYHVAIDEPAAWLILEADDLLAEPML